MKIQMVVPVLLAVLLAGCKLSCLFCVLSLHPLYEERNLVSEPALAGSWTDESGHDTWTFAQDGERAYKLTITTDENPDKDENPLKFEVHLLQLGGLLFLDLSDQDSGLTGIPGHVFAKVRLEGDQLGLAFLSNGWMKQKLVQERSLSFVPTGDGKPIAITASTGDLQYFFVRYATDAKAFEEEGVLRRK